MIEFLWALFLLSGAWLAHLALWHTRPPRNHTLGLLLVFLLAPFLLTAAAFYVNAPPPSPLGWFQILSFYLPCALAYTAAYSAIEHESPTCRMVRLVDAAPDGMAHTDLLAALEPERIIDTRLESLRHTGGVAYENNRYTLLPKGLKLARLFRFVAHIFGIRGHGT